MKENSIWHGLSLNTIYNMDCIEGMKLIPDWSIDCIITSPPYNMNTMRSDCYYNNWYSEIDWLSEEEYIKIRTDEFIEFDRILDRRWVILYNISYGKDNPILPTLLMTNIHNNTDMTIVDIISRKKNNAIPFQTSPTKLSRIVELIYVIVKKDELHTFRTNKQISKINEKTNQKFYKNYVNYIEAKNNDNLQTTHKATYSCELCEKLIDIYAVEWSVVLDPFMWIGTTAIACINTNRNFIWFELDEWYRNIANKRIQDKLSEK